MIALFTHYVPAGCVIHRQLRNLAVFFLFRSQVKSATKCIGGTCLNGNSQTRHESGGTRKNRIWMAMLGLTSAYAVRPNFSLR